jgi:DNA replication and repair protein RecF
LSFYLQNIKLTNYKNYSSIKLDLNAKFNAFVGLNGQGKTNLLDAIYYLSIAKSNFTASDREVVKFERDFFRLEGYYQDSSSNQQKLVIKVKPGKLKEIEFDDKKYTKRSEHIGRVPIVIVTPDDLVDLLATSECRRKFLDSSLIQYDRAYLKSLMSYNRLLKQRNALLKQMAENRTWNEMLLQVIDDEMKPEAEHIYAKRKKEARLLTPVFVKIYESISQKAEQCRIEYKSGMDTLGFAEQMKEARDKDRILKRTTAGIHKDDIAFWLNDKKLNKYGSQGQLKSFVFALKLAQYHFLKSQKKVNPILLLDDVFDKLDAHRVQSLIEIISSDDYGQIFLSDTSKERMEKIFSSLNLSHSIFHLRNGALIK